MTASIVDTIKAITSAVSSCCDFLPPLSMLSVDILWSMVINHLPKLKDEVTALLDNE